MGVLLLLFFVWVYVWVLTAKRLCIIIPFHCAMISQFFMIIYAVHLELSFHCDRGGYNLFFSCNRAFHHRQGCWHPQHLFWKVKLLKKDIKSITIFELYAFSICYLVKQLWEHYQSRWLNLSSSLEAYLWVLLNHVQILDCKT